MIKASGILFLVGNTALFLRRGNGSSHPNEWCCPGGHIEGNETAEQGAIRETLEEAGRKVDPSEMELWTRTIAPAETAMEQVTEAEPAIPGEVPAPSEDVDFTTFVVRLNEQFIPVLALDEHDGYAWAPVTAPPQPLHPGVQIALDRISMDELGVARAMAAGQLASPQHYRNVWLVAMRITGTGASYRHDRKEFVWRDPSIYLNEEFMARCNGLPVIWEHPEKSLLTHDEFHERKLGSIFLPYLRPDKPDDVWGIAKIYDDDAAKAISDEQLSTSPAVAFGKMSGNQRFEMEDGETMLIEGKPMLLDHLAICPVGVWDKGGDPTGIESADAVADAASKPQRSSLDFNLLRAHAAAVLVATQARAYF